MDERGGELQFKVRLRRTTRPAAAASSLFMLQGCNRGILNPVGPVGSAEKEILINSTAIMLAIIIPTIIATVAIAWWFRAGNKRAKYRPDWEYSGAIELVVWSIPALTIMLLGGIAWIGSHDLEPSRPLKSSVSPIRVDVVSLDWKWLFIYPDQGIATVNQLVVPAGTPVNFRLTSGNGLERVLRPANGDDDLHHAEDDHAAQSRSRPARNLRRHLGPFQRRWISWNAV